MKYLLFLLGLSLTVLACQQDNSDAAIGTWRVSYYYDNAKDETSKFSGYSFDIKAGGAFVATLPSGEKVTGNWVQNSSSNKFIISISGTEALDDMVDDWQILEQTDNLIKLKDDSKEEFLHLSRL